MSLDKMKSVVRDILMIAISPLLFIRGMWRSGILSVPAGEVVSLSPENNTCNDHLGYPYFRSSTRTFGLFGNNHRILIGDFLGAKVPFLQYLIPAVGGVPLYLVLSLICYASFWLYASWDRPILGSLGMFYFFCTPYFKNNALETGRLDFLGWPLAFFSLVFLINDGNPLIAAVPMIVATFIHLSIPLYMFILWGVMVLSAMVVQDHSLAVRLITTGTITIALTGWWFIPFFRIAKFLSLHQRTWNLEDSRGEDRTRSKTIFFKKLIPYGLFALYQVPALTYTDTIILFTPVVVSIAEQWSQRFINRFSIESIFLLSASYVLLRHFSWISALLFGVSFFSYASPARRWGFDFKAMTFGPHHRSVFDHLFPKMDPSKGRPLFLKSNHDFTDKMIDIKRVGVLVTGALMTQPDAFEVCYAPMSKGNRLIDIDRYTMIYPPKSLQEIETLAVDWEVRYLIVTSDHLAKEMGDAGFCPRWVQEFSKFGNLPAFTVRIYEIDFDRHLIHRELVMAPNKMTVRFNGTDDIFIPYRGYGWIPDDPAARKRCTGNGFFLKAHTNTTITCRYKYSSFFSPSYRDSVES